MYAVMSRRAGGWQDERELTLPDSPTTTAVLGSPTATAEQRVVRTPVPPSRRRNAGGARKPAAVMLGRLAKGESGVALALAVMLVVLIGVMGAGLLTLVVIDLEATVEANRGQRAFEMAEAGVEVARARLAADPDLSDWSSGELSIEGGEGAVLVTIERSDSESAYFAATSTGEYAGARRRIEATFSLVSGEPDLLGWRELYE
ncbi:MAG TPA: hypothetical protein VK869_03285 [Rubrobacteraceae bacterium]|nr:hypothetical protein [Rubrobacteraceae bacterium]